MAVPSSDHHVTFKTSVVCFFVAYSIVSKYLLQNLMSIKYDHENIKATT